MKFEDLKLSPDVLRAVVDAGYTVPTPIQELAIPYVQMGRDILGCAQTGTGKTASFVLPMIDILTAGRARARMPRSLILTPTRELAAQISGNFETYGKYHKLSMALIIGGESIVAQEQKLDRGVDVLIATPGRLIDHFGRGGLLLNDVKILVIDEGDRMLDMGFIPDIERIVSFLPKIRQTLFFSATFPAEIRRLADKFLINPKEINVTPPASPAEMVDHFLVPAGMREKLTVLRRLLGRLDRRIRDHQRRDGPPLGGLADLEPMRQIGTLRDPVHQRDDFGVSGRRLKPAPLRHRLQIVRDPLLRSRRARADCEHT